MGICIKIINIAGIFLSALLFVSCGIQVNSEDPDVAFTNMAKNLATLVLAAVIGRFIPGFDVLKGSAMAVAEYIKKYDPLSGAVSFVSRQYVHIKGYFVNNTMAVKKYVTTVYTKKDYGGSATVSVYYFIHKLNI